MKKLIAKTSLLVAAVFFLSGCASLSRDWDRATTQDSSTAYESFLKRHPDSQYTSEAKARIEELDWKQAQKSSKAASIRKFLKKHPKSKYAGEAKARLVTYSKDAWEKARRLDKVYSYENFMRTYPESEFIEKAKERVIWQRANRAVVEIDYPKTVHAGFSPYWNISGPIYKWDTVFKETSGKAGFKLKATNFYIRAPNGGRWSNNWSKDVSVKPKGRAAVDYWCDKSSKWAGGNYYTTWVGEDDWGNRISIVQKVRLVK
jgi:hypothetical protein